MNNKSTTLAIPVSPEVAAFAVVMEARLIQEGCDNFETWGGMPVTKLMSYLVTKAKRLAEADPTNVSDLFKKAVGIGNLAMMIAEKASQEIEKTLGSDEDFTDDLVRRSTSPQRAPLPCHSSNEQALVQVSLST